MLLVFDGIEVVQARALLKLAPKSLKRVLIDLKADLLTIIYPSESPENKKFVAY